MVEHNTEHLNVDELRLLNEQQERLGEAFVQKYGNNAIFDAAIEGNVGILRYMNRHQFNVGGKDLRNHDMSAVHLSVLMGKKASLQVLSQMQGFDVNAQDREGRTALMLASDMGRLDMVDALLKMGADVSLKDNNGHSAFDYAQKNQYSTVAEALRREELQTKKPDLLNTFRKIGHSMPADMPHQHVVGHDRAD